MAKLTDRQKPNEKVDSLLEHVRALTETDRLAFFTVLRAEFPQEFRSRFPFDFGSTWLDSELPKSQPVLDLGKMGPSDGAKLASERPSVVFDPLGKRRR